MRTPEAHSLLARLMDRVITDTTDEAEQMLTEDVADFLSQERWERERRQFFLETPLVVGFAGEVREPGSYITREAMGIPLLITRDRNGTLHALINSCAHRGARVADGYGRRPRLVCRFHGWTFELDGRLSARPKEQCFAAADEHTNLRKLPVCDRSGLIVVGLDSAMPQSRVDDHLSSIEAQFTAFNFERATTLEVERIEVPANWKLISGISYESYHFATLHRTSVATMFSDHAVCDFFGRHSRWVFGLKGTEKFRERDPSTWPTRIPWAVNHQLFPGTVMIGTWQVGQIIRAEPGPTPGTSVVHYIGVCLDEVNLEEIRANYELGSKAFTEEDLPAVIESYQGLKARGDLIHIGRNEPVVQFWHRLWRDLLRD